MNPPHSPTMTKMRASAETDSRPAGPVSAPNQPMTNEPTTLISNVPHGSRGPNSWAVQMR